eukprot:GSMAST32.ASY1.ANO1.1128.1 assembled CDS
MLFIIMFPLYLCLYHLYMDCLPFFESLFMLLTMAEAAVLAGGTQVDKGENARLASFVGAIAIADLVLLVDISKNQDSEVGDGTTSVVVLAGEFLREAEKLVQQRIHPMTIIDGFRMATKAARTALRESSVDNTLTTLSSKLLTHEKDHFANLAIIKKPGGRLEESYLDNGFVMSKKIGVGCPKRIENAKIMIANTSMDTDKIKIYGAPEKKKMKGKVDKIVKHGVNVFINRQLIYNWPEQLFADAEICSTFEHPELVSLGTCDLIEEIMIGEDKCIRFSGCKSGSACSIVLRGASKHLLDEAERSLHDALCVLLATVKEPRVTYGGGCAETLMAKACDELVPKVAGKKSLAIEAFARALRQMPATIADNAGFDSAELVTQLRNAHFNGKTTAGLDMAKGSIGCMSEIVLLSAAEAAEMILRVDDIIKCAPQQRQG